MTAAPDNASSKDAPDKSIPENAFTCRRCGACCRIRGEVRLTGQDIAAISHKFGMIEEEFIDKHTRLASNRQWLVLADRKDGSCEMISESGLCIINDVKPEQCRNFPSRWRNPDSASYCPELAALGSPHTAAWQSPHTAAAAPDPD